MGFDTTTILFNEMAAGYDLWPYHVPVGGRTQAQTQDGMVRQTYHEHVWILSLAGCGLLETGGAAYQIPAGGFVWLDTTHPYAHGAADGEGWSYLWCSVSGHSIDVLQERLGFLKAPVQARFAESRGDFERILEALAVQAVGAQAEISAAVGNILVALSMCRPTPDDTRSVDTVARATAAMRQKIDKHWTVPEIAKIARISQSQLYRRFKEDTGSSPMEWLRRERIVLATYLLRSTPLPVGAIAQQCGYADPLHFSRDFKRLRGVAPRQFRKAFLDQA